MTASDVLTLADLENWPGRGPSLAVLGHPIAHSLSPAMHHAALARLALAEPAYADWRYCKFDVRPEALAEALPVFHARGFVGLNLTIPHKVLAVDLIEYVQEDAAEAGAVNTLRRTSTGYEGFNTDGYGIVRAIRDAFGLSIKGASVILLGAGGAARAAAVACLREGCESLWIGNRTADKLGRLLQTLAPVASTFGSRLEGFALASGSDFPKDALVINATSAGLKPGDPAPIDLAAFKGRPHVYDMIYNPRETPLLRQARVLGFPAANGLSMLAHQGARALEIWTGREVDAAVMLKACEQALHAR